MADRVTKLSAVQAARFFAALSVVAYHANRSVALPQYLGHQPLGPFIDFGHAGVDFFFVLSGFIITYVHASDIGHPARLARYAWRRVTRIYPIYWFVTVLEIGHGAFAPDAASRLAPEHLLKSFLLLPDQTWPLVSVAWTLRYEMAFYAIFAICIVERRLCWPLAFCAVTGSFLSAGIETDSAWAGLVLSPYNLLFLMGIAAARYVNRSYVRCPSALVACGTVFFLFAGAMEVAGFVPINGLEGRILYGVSSVAILLGLVELERADPSTFDRVPAVWGESSYGLYLIHLTVIPLAVRALAALGLLAVVPGAVLIVALILLSLGLAIAMHIGLETPMARFFRRHTPRQCV